MVNGKAFPPKYVIDQAGKLLGHPFGPEKFAGGDQEANRVLRKFKFEVRDRRRNFLQYWKPREVQAEIEREAKTGEPLQFIGGAQLKNMRTGDTVWIVTSGSQGELLLCGRYAVEEVLDQKGLRERLGREPVFDAPWYAYAREELRRPMGTIDITKVVPALRFIPERHLTLKGGRVNPQQLQRIRLLSSQSASLIEGEWSRPRRGAEPSLDSDTLAVLNDFLEDRTDDLDEEGARTYRRQQLLERSPKNRARVLSAKGYACEVCGYEFEVQFPGFSPSAHVHHKKPLAIGTRKGGSIEDFAVLCAPCHTAAHMGNNRKLKPWSVEELRKKIQRRWDN